MGKITHIGNSRESRSSGDPEVPVKRDFPPIVWLSEPFEASSSEYLVRGLLEPQAFAVLYGEPGSGKSLLAMSLAFAIASGTPWRGRETSQGLVVHIAGEGVRGLRRRQAAHCQHFNVPRTVPYAVLPVAAQLTPGEDEAVVTLVAQTAKAIGCPPRLVIVDTLARCLVGDENASADMAAFIKACDYVRSCTGTAVLVVHHSGKDASRGARGHSSLRAAADTELQVEGATNPRTLHVRKQRDLELAEPMTFDLDPVTLATEADGKNITACIVRHSDQAPPQPKPSGKQQAQLLAELERRYVAGTLAWTDSDLRAIGRGLGMHKASARSAALGLHSAGYLAPSVGGSTLAQRPQVSA